MDHAAPSPARPRLVVSRCLELDACRYNGATVRAPLVAALARHVDLVPVCPEVEVGLGVPRDPIRLVGPQGTRLVQPTSGRDLTETMRGFGERFLGGLGEVDGFLLKSRSPSCGVGDVKVYAGAHEAVPVGRGAGLFASAVLERFPDRAVEDEGRLADAGVRDRWLTALFALAALRRARSRGGGRALAGFHAAHEMTLMAAPAVHRESAERAAALPSDDAWEGYARAFRRAVLSGADPERHARVLERALGWVEGEASSGDVRRVGSLVEAYRAGRVTRLEPLTALGGLARAHPTPRLSGQAYLRPYPDGLLAPTPAGSP